MDESTNDTCESNVQIYLRNPSNIIRTVFLVISWIILSLHFELIGPTMIILAFQTQVTYNGIANALSARSGGYLAANLFCAIFQKLVRNYSDLILVASFILPAIVVFVTPFITSITLMSVLFFVQGLAMGLTNMGGNNILFDMWGVNSAAPMSLVHLGYGLGAVFVNLLVRPFLDGDNRKDLQMNNTNTSLLPSTIVLSSKPNIQIPYFIVASFCLLIAVGHLLFHIHSRNDRQKQLKVDQTEYQVINTIRPGNVSSGDQSEYSPATCGRGFFGYGLSLSTTFITYMFFVGGTDQTFSKFFFSYLKFDKFQISTRSASWGIILYWSSYSTGRFIGAIASVFISVSICLTLIWCSGLSLAIMWMIYVWKIGLSSTSLFILACFTGLTVSPIMPLSFGWFNQKLNVVPSFLGLLLCGSALGSLVLQKMAGIVMDRDPNHFPTLLTVCIILPILLYILANLITFFHERRLTNEQNVVVKAVSFKSDDCTIEK